MIGPDKIDKYINDQLNYKERAEVEELFLEEEENTVFRRQLENDFNRITNEPASEDVRISQLLDKINHKIRENEAGKKQKPLNRVLEIYMKVAAVLLIPLVIAAALLLNSLNISKPVSEEPASSSIMAPLGSRVSFTLPDGTTGMLNSGSSISYSIPFNLDRQVNLSGEGWFEIKPDPEHPFTINALNSKVIARGTSFNICAYPDENYLEVVLNTGKVEFLGAGADEAIFLLPSERLVLKDGSISKSLIDTSKYNAWTQGKLVFRGDQMSEVAKKLARWYNVNIILADKKLESYSFRGTFEDDKIEDILAFLAMTSPISYEIIPREQMPDGSFTKESIIIHSLTTEN